MELNLSGFITEKQFTNLLSDINKGTSIRREQLQCALRHAAFHAAVHRNADPSLRLFAVVGKETNVKGMAKWLELNAPIGFRDGVAFYHEKKWKTIYATLTGVEVERELMKAIPFWRHKDKSTDIEDTPIDYLELVRAIIKKAETNAKKVEGKKAEKHRELIDQLATLCNNTQYA